MAEGRTFPVEVLVPEGEVFTGEVEMLSTRTTAGEIGIKARHVPLMAMLVPATLRLHLGGGEVKRFAQGDGYLQVYANHAQVLVEEAIPPDELDSARLREQIADAGSRIGESGEGSADRARAERDKRRWETFLTIAAESD